MAECRHIRDIERWFDGEAELSDSVRKHLDTCRECAAALARMEAVRQSTERETPRIEDAQMPAFVAGIRERVSAPPRRWTGLWAYASLATAALLVALSAFVMFSGPAREVEAHTVIESFSTELENATVETYSSDNGTATIWVTVPEGDDIW